jgi:hypothetical protein
MLIRLIRELADKTFEFPCERFQASPGFVMTRADLGALGILVPPEKTAPATIRFSSHDRTTATTFRTLLCQYIPNSGGLQYVKTRRPEEGFMSKQTVPPSGVARWWQPFADTSPSVPWLAASA